MVAVQTRANRAAAARLVGLIADTVSFLRAVEAWNNAACAVERAASSDNRHRRTNTRKSKDESTPVAVGIMRAEEVNEGRGVKALAAWLVRCRGWCARPPSDDHLAQLVICKSSQRVA